MSETTCWPCRSGKCAGCTANLIDFDCVCDHVTRQVPVEQGSIAEALNLEPQEPDSKTRTRRYKSDDAVTDQQSTGRKRAAKLYPLKDANGNKLPCDLWKVCRVAQLHGEANRWMRSATRDDA